MSYVRDLIERLLRSPSDYYYLFPSELRTLFESLPSFSSDHDNLNSSLQLILILFGTVAIYRHWFPFRPVLKTAVLLLPILISICTVSEFHFGQNEGTDVHAYRIGQVTGHLRNGLVVSAYFFAVAAVCARRGSRGAQS
jgi:hypothetical protein